MTTPSVVITDTGAHDPGPAVRLLAEAGFRTRVLETRDPERVAAEAVGAVALIVHHTRVDAALLDALPTLRLILTTDPHGSGIDVAEAERRGLWVCLPPRRESAAQAAARALSMALAQLRRIAAERLTCFRPAPRACDLTLGLIGMESAATEFANLALPLFRRVGGTGAQWCRWPHGVVQTDLYELLATADIVSLHLPATPATRSLIGAHTLPRMRPGAILINLASPDLVDRDALLTALDTGMLAGYSAGYALAETGHFHESCALRHHPSVVFSPEQPGPTGDQLCALARHVIAWRDRGFPFTTGANPLPLAASPLHAPCSRSRFRTTGPDGRSATSMAGEASALR